MEARSGYWAAVAAGIVDRPAEPDTEVTPGPEEIELAPEGQEKINTWLAENGERITQHLEAFGGYEGLWQLVLDELRVPIPGTGEEIVVTPDGAGGVTWAPYKQVKEVFDEYVQFGFLTDEDIAKVPGLLGTTLRRVTPGGAGAKEAPKGSIDAGTVESTPASAEAVPEIIDLYDPPQGLTLTQFLAAIESGHLKGFSAGHAGEFGIPPQFRGGIEAMFPGGVVTDEGLAQLKDSWIMRDGNHYTNGGFFQSLVAHERTNRERGTAEHEDHELIESDRADEPGPAEELVGTAGERGDEPGEEVIAAGEAEVADGNADSLTGEVAHEGALDAEAEPPPNPHELVDALSLPRSDAGALFMETLPRGEAGPAQTAEAAQERINVWVEKYRQELERQLALSRGSVEDLEKSILFAELNGNGAEDQERIREIRREHHDKLMEQLERYFDPEQQADPLFNPASALDHLGLTDPALLEEVRTEQPEIFEQTKEELEAKLRDPAVAERDKGYAVGLTEQHRRLFGEPPADRETASLEGERWQDFSEVLERPTENLDLNLRRVRTTAAYELALNHSTRLRQEPQLQKQVIDILQDQVNSMIRPDGVTSYDAGRAIHLLTHVNRALAAARGSTG